MKIIECEQGTAEWFEARLGIPTASRFDKILTPKKLELSKSADFFISTLIHEIQSGEFEDDGETDWMNRGRGLEPIAADEYSFKYDVDLQQVGFVTTDDGLIGCSPDRFIVGQKAGLEIKGHGGAWHIHYMRHPDIFEEKHRCQVQGSLWITEFDYWDLMSYHPYYSSVIIRYYPDPKFKAAIESAMYGDTGFLARLKKAKEELKSIVENKNARKQIA